MGLHNCAILCLERNFLLSCSSNAFDLTQHNTALYCTVFNQVLALLTAKEDDVATTLLMLPFAFQDFEVTTDFMSSHTGISEDVYVVDLIDN